MSAWEGRIADELGLTPADVKEIKTRHPDEFKLQTMWKERLGKDATYKNLIMVFEKAGYKQYADNVAAEAANCRQDTATVSDAGVLDSYTIHTIRANEAKIKHSFSVLLQNLGKALKAQEQQLDVDEVHDYLMGICPTVPKGSLNEMFKFVTSKNVWSYQNYSLLEEFVEYFLNPHEMEQMDKYMSALSGFCVTTNLIDYIKSKKFAADKLQESTDKDQPPWNEEHCRKVQVRLNVGRKVSELSLQYVYDLWKKIAKHFDIPHLTTIIQEITTGSLIIVWLESPIAAEKIASRASTEESILFFLQHEIVFVAIDDQPIFDAMQFLLRLVKQDDWQKLKTLFQEHRELFDLNASRDGKSLLMTATELGEEHVIKVLLDHGADITLKQESTGRTALSFAAENGHAAAKATLLAYGAESHQALLDKATSNGQKALSLTQWKDGLQGSTKLDSKSEITDDLSSYQSPNSKALATSSGHVMKEGKQTPLRWEKSSESKDKPKNESKGGMLIHVNGLSETQGTVTLQVEATDTIEKVKAELQLIVGIPSDQQRLFYAANNLKEGGGPSAKIYVKTEIGKKITLNAVDLSQTIKSVKTHLQYQEGYRHELQQLFFGRQQLEDGHTLDDYNIISGSTLNLTLISRGHAFVRRLSGETVLAPSIYDTVKAIKSKIQEETGLKVANQQLVHSGRTLPDDDVVKKYDVHSEDTIYLAMKSGESKLLCCVHVIEKNKCITLVMKPSDKVKDIKRKIESEENIPIAWQEMKYRDEVLKDNISLSLYGLKTISNLNLTVTTETGLLCCVHAKEPLNRCITLVMNRSDKVEDMKRKISSEENIPIDRLKIIYKDVVLQDEVTLSDYGLETVSDLDLTVTTSSSCAIQ